MNRDFYYDDDLPLTQLASADFHYSRNGERRHMNCCCNVHYNPKREEADFWVYAADDVIAGIIHDPTTLAILCPCMHPRALGAYPYPSSPFIAVVTAQVTRDDWRCFCNRQKYD